MKSYLSSASFSRVVSFFEPKQRAAKTKAARTTAPSVPLDAHVAHNHGAICPDNITAKPAAPELNLALPPRSHGQYVMRFELLSPEQRVWCKVNLPRTATIRASEQQIREFKGAPYPSINTVQVTTPKPPIAQAPRTVEEYKSMRHGMSFEQFHWCLWNVPGMKRPSQIEHERALYVGQPFPQSQE